MKSPSKIGCSRDEQLLYAMAEAGSEVPTQDHSSTPLEMVTEFAECMGQPLNVPWCEDKPLEELRWDMISEEYEEAFDESCYKKNPENMLKELADMSININGYCATYGWNLDEAIRRVHLSNMSKLGQDGKPVKDSRGKVLKGPNYKPAILTDLVETNNE
tara:strand:+ start:2188 stop:2667 length:480 start_codon:yes stop_codon:yes gene_type:complete